VRAFYLGMKFDARLAAIVSLPLLFFFSTAYIVIVEALLAILYAADFASYGYIHQRLNAEVLEFLRNPIISMHMVWESYHVVWFALAVLGFLALLVVLVKPRAASREPRAARIAIAILFLACIYGKFSRYPLRWSDAFFSTDSFIAELALNPAQYLFESMREERPGRPDQNATPFVGREREMAEMRAGLEDTNSGRGRLRLESALCVNRQRQASRPSGRLTIPPAVRAGPPTGHPPWTTPEKKKLIAVDGGLPLRNRSAARVGSLPSGIFLSF